MAKKKAGGAAAARAAAEAQRAYDSEDLVARADRLARLIEVQRDLKFEITTLAAKLCAAKRRLKLTGWDLETAAAALRRSREARAGNEGVAQDGGQ